MSVRFKASQVWMQRLLADAPASCGNNASRISKVVVPATTLIPLLSHGAMDACTPPDVSTSLQIPLRGKFAMPTVKCFVRDARIVSSQADLRVRSTDVLLRTDNYLTALFRPPKACDVRPSLAYALRAIEHALHRGQHNCEALAVTALVASQILLTIHPFSDGNGRTARFFFAAQLIRFGLVDAIPILAMMLMYRGGAHEYHQASWQLRAGDVAPMVDLFLRSAELVPSLLPSHVRDLSPREVMARCWQSLRALD